MLAIRIGYGGVVSEELALPLSPADYETAHRIWREGRACQQTVTVYTLRSPVQPFLDLIIGMDCGEESIQREPNFLGMRLRHMTKTKQNVFSVALKLKRPGTLKEIIDRSYNLDSCYLDHRGDDCPSGLVRKREDAAFVEIDQEHLPDPGYDKNSLFLLHLRRAKGMVGEH